VKITTKKIMRELEKKGWHNATGEWNEIDIDLIKAVRKIILKEIKNAK
jgi:hypothetical protein